MLVSNEAATRCVKSAAAILLVLSALPLLCVQAHEALPAGWQDWAIAASEHLGPFSLFPLMGVSVELPALAQAYIDWLGAFETVVLAIGLPICLVGLIANRDRLDQIAMPPALILIGGALALGAAHRHLARVSDLASSGAQLVLMLLGVAMILLLAWAIVLAFKPPPQRFGRKHEYNYVGEDGGGD